MGPRVAFSPTILPSLSRHNWKSHQLTWSSYIPNQFFDLWDVHTPFWNRYRKFPRNPQAAVVVNLLTLKFYLFLPSWILAGSVLPSEKGLAWQSWLVMTRLPPPGPTPLGTTLLHQAMCWASGWRQVGCSKWDSTSLTSFYTEVLVWQWEFINSVKTVVEHRGNLQINRDFTHRKKDTAK